MTQHASTSRSATVVAVAGLVFLSLVWGTQFLVIKIGQQTVPSLLTAAIRFAVLTGVAQVSLWVTRQRTPRQAWKARVAFGAAQAASICLLYWSEKKIPSAEAGLVFGTTPLFVAGLAHWFVHGERLDGRTLVALVAGFAGVAVLSLRGWVEHTASSALAIGVALATGAAFANALNKVLAKKLTGLLSAAILLRDMGLVVTVVAGGLSLAVENHERTELTPGALAAAVYLGVVASAAASWLYLVLLRRFRVTALAYLQFVTALVALATGAAVGRENLGLASVLAAAAILSGLLILARAPARP